MLIAGRRLNTRFKRTARTIAYQRFHNRLSDNAAAVERRQQIREEIQITQTQCQTRRGGPVAQDADRKRSAVQTRCRAGCSQDTAIAKPTHWRGVASSRRGDQRHPGCMIATRPQLQSLPMSAAGWVAPSPGVGREATGPAKQRQQQRLCWLIRWMANRQQGCKCSVSRSAVQQHLPRVIWGVPSATIKQIEMKRIIQELRELG